MMVTKSNSCASGAIFRECFRSKQPVNSERRTRAQRVGQTMGRKFAFFVLTVLLVKACVAASREEDTPVEGARTRFGRQTARVDTCVLGCVTSAMQNIGLSNIRPSSWSWKLSDMIQSSLLRSFCQAFDQASSCVSSCSLSPSRLLISSLMGVPGILCTGSEGAKACIQEVSKTMRNTCDNKCGDMKPTMGNTLTSFTRMTSIFNDMCAYWGCQIACEKPAVERQCGQESKTIMNKISGIGLQTLKSALKGAGLRSVCGANATRIPNTYEIVTDRPMVDDGEGGGEDGGNGEDRPPTDYDDQGGEEEDTSSTAQPVSTRPRGGTRGDRGARVPTLRAVNTDGDTGETNLRLTD